MLEWTREPPSEPGWYWQRVRDRGRLSQQVVCAYFHGGGIRYDDGGWSRLRDVEVAWSGPIPEPTDPREVQDAD